MMKFTISNDLMLFLNGYFGGLYPDFIRKNKLTNEIPVFVFHHVDQREFGECLHHLKENNYKTLTADQYELALHDRASIPEKSVVITFDDGLSDVYYTAYPVLKKYDFKAVVFLIAGWMDQPGMLTWDQVKEIHQSGVIDFQSHSMNHPAIFNTPEIVDFYQPKYLKSKLWNVPLVTGRNGAMKIPAFGAPLYKFSSRFSDEKRFFPDSKLEQLCVEHVNKNGKEEFFKNSKRRNELFQIADNYRRKSKEVTRIETDDEQMNSIRDEIVESKKMIERHLPNKVIRHFAWPWNQTGLVTIRLFAESGYATSFMGMSAGIKVENEKEQNKYLIKRVTGDFIKCLPGDGRKSFRAVMLQKTMRRLTSGPTY